jgi:D-alanine-D-alanine ligase
MAVPASSSSNSGGAQAAAQATASGGPEDSDPLKRSARAAMAAAAQPSIEPLAARPGLRVGVLHNSKLAAPALNGNTPKDVLAELDNPRNVQDYVTALRALGHTVMAFDGGPGLTALLAEHSIDICFNTCEGRRGDSREAQVPALLEMLGVPYSASKVLALAITLDKAMTKRVLSYHHLPTPGFQEFQRPGEQLQPALARRLSAGGALFVKPNREGTGMGIYGDALVRSEAALRERVAYIIDAYRQTALVEEYIEGRDVTCGLVGNLAPDGGTEGLHLFPISEVDHSVYPPGTEPFYSYTIKVEMAELYRGFCPAPIPDPIAAEVRRLTIETFRACGCLDVARVDFRLDTANNLQPMILEINALPGLAYNSDLTLCAEADSWTHHELIQAVFNAAVERSALLGRAMPASPLPLSVTETR